MPPQGWSTKTVNRITDYIYDVLSKNLPRNTLADFSIPIAARRQSQRLLPLSRPPHTPDELKEYWRAKIPNGTLSLWIDFVDQVYTGGRSSEEWVKDFELIQLEDTNHREKVAMQLLAALAIEFNLNIEGKYPCVGAHGMYYGFHSKNHIHGWHGDHLPRDLDNAALLDWRRYLYGYPKVKLSAMAINLRRLYVISKDLGTETGLYEGYAELVRYWSDIGPDERILHYLVHTHLNPDYIWQQQLRKREPVSVEFKPSRAAKMRLASLAYHRWHSLNNPLPLIVAALRDDFPDVRELMPMIQHFDYFHFPVTHSVPAHIKDYWFHLITKGNQQYAQLKYRKRNRVGRPAKGRRGHYIL
jgi:hypothetical protein